jgi:osmotically-inducible protein OsmY
MEPTSLDHLPQGELIRSRVKRELTRNTLLRDEELLVSGEGDKIILEGVVDSSDKKWLAEDIALDTFGVLHVDNQIEVHRLH